MEQLFLWTKRIVIFMLFSTVLINVAGKNGKYIKIVSGFMLILLVAEPFIKLLGGGQLLEYELQKEIFMYDARVPGYINERADILINKTMTENYHALIKENAAIVGKKYGLTLCDFEVRTNENTDDEEYGTVLEMSCNFEKAGTDMVARDIDVVIEVDIRIDERSNTEGMEKGEKSKETETEKSIKKELADFYNISIDNIYIYIREGR